MGADNVIRLGDEFSIDLDRAIGDLRVAFGDDVTVS
jgi:hypothetical protein